MTTSRNLIKPRHLWTALELATLQAQYPHQRTADLATQLGIDLQQVYSRATKLGLRKSAVFHASDKSGRIFKGGTLGQLTQFAPGQAPWNAGTHYAPGGRCAETQFKKGQQPHTTMTVGSYRIVTEKTGRQHLEQKTNAAKGSNDKRWTPVTRLVWQAAHGPVPAGHIVVFKPGQHSLKLEDITLEKLDCITRSANARRNSVWTHSPEVAQLYQLKGAITRQVNRITKESQTT